MKWKLGQASDGQHRIKNKEDRMKDIHMLRLSITKFDSIRTFASDNQCPKESLQIGLKISNDPNIAYWINVYRLSNCCGCMIQLTLNWLYLLHNDLLLCSSNDFMT